MQTKSSKQILQNAKPFLKWAGGKTQLLNELETRLPHYAIKNRKISNYVEPFIGGGAFFFYLKNKYKIENSIICDVNNEIIIAYKVIQNEPSSLIELLFNLEQSYYDRSENEREPFYYKVREEYNKQINNFDFLKYNDDWIKRSAYLIFLNKTCFNGLFRQNKSGEFNVPFGKYKNPKICDKENLIQVSQALTNTLIIAGDFTKTEPYINDDSIVYFDPPYRPLNNTSSFTSYYKENFNDESQKRLADFYHKMNSKKAFLMLSNSDPKNENPNENFFDFIYSDFKIERVNANRMINSNAEKRGKIKELIITNIKN